MKKAILLCLTLIFLMLLSSCTSVRVLSDYDQQVDFKAYKTYAFYKTGIDKAQISDLDKKRILRAIDNEMTAKGFTKSETPDVLISIFTKEQDRVDIFDNNFALGWGYYPWTWGPSLSLGLNTVTTTTVGSLYIDFIDTKNKELVWQGTGKGAIPQTNNVAKKEERIKEFVSQILAQYPPQITLSK